VEVLLPQATAETPLVWHVIEEISDQSLPVDTTLTPLELPAVPIARKDAE